MGTIADDDLARLPLWKGVLEALITNSVTIKPRLMEMSAPTALESPLTSIDCCLWSRIMDAPRLWQSSVR